MDQTNGVRINYEVPKWLLLNFSYHTHNLEFFFFIYLVMLNRNWNEGNFLENTQYSYHDKKSVIPKKKRDFLQFFAKA